MLPLAQEKLHGFSQRPDGSLAGPFTAMLHWPAWGRGVWEQTRTLMETTVLPKTAHEVVIPVTGADARVAYELHAHERIATEVGLAPAKIATLVAGQRPADLDADEAAAHDLAAALVRGDPVPDATYEAARAQLGDDGAAEVVFLVAGYSAVSVLLNGFAVEVLPDER